MASTPNFGSTGHTGTVQLTSADGTTPKDVGNFTPPTAGLRVLEIRIHSGPTTAPGGTYTVQVLVHDGTSAFIFDQVTLINVANLRQGVLRYHDFKLPFGYKIQVVTRAALASGAALDFVVVGEDLN